MCSQDRTLPFTCMLCLLHNIWDTMYFFSFKTTVTSLLAHAHAHITSFELRHRGAFVAVRIGPSDTTETLLLCHDACTSSPSHLVLQLSMSHASDQLWALAHSISHQSHSSAQPSAQASTAPGGIPRNSSGGGNASSASSPTGPEASLCLLVLPCWGTTRRSA